MNVQKTYPLNDVLSGEWTQHDVQFHPSAERSSESYMTERKTRNGDADSGDAEHLNQHAWQQAEKIEIQEIRPSVEQDVVQKVSLLQQNIRFDYCYSMGK